MVARWKMVFMELTLHTYKAEEDSCFPLNYYTFDRFIWWHQLYYKSTPFTMYFLYGTQKFVTWSDFELKSATYHTVFEMGWKFMKTIFCYILPEFISAVNENIGSFITDPPFLISCHFVLFCLHCKHHDRVDAVELLLNFPSSSLLWCQSTKVSSACLYQWTNFTEAATSVFWSYCSMQKLTTAWASGESGVPICLVTELSTVEEIGHYESLPEQTQL